MNDFFSVLDDFEIQEFVSADGESDYTGSSFSIDSYDDASGSTETATRDELVNQEVKLSSVKRGSSTREAINNITESDANKSQSGMVYVWDSGVSPVTGSTGNVYATFVGGSEGTKSFYDADGNVTSTVPYTVVTLNNIAGLSFESSGTLEFDPSLDGNYDMGIQATAGVSLTMSRGNVTGGSFLRGDSTLTLYPPNGDVEVITTLETYDFPDNSVSFVAENEDIKSVTTDKANGTIELTADANSVNYDFLLDGSQVKFKNVTAGTLKATYDDGSLTIDASGFTSDTDNLQAVALGDADIFIPPTEETTVRIGSTNYTYSNSGNAYFMVDDTTVEGYVLSAATDAITVTKSNEIDVYDEDDTTKVLANVTGKNYTITKLAEDAYSVNITESTDVVIGDTTFNFTISNTTKGSNTFRNGVTVYFDEDLNVTGVQGLNLFGAGDSMKVTAPNVTEADGGIALINSSRNVQNGNITSAIVAGYVSVSDGDFTYSGSDSGIPTINVATGTQVYSVSDATTTATNRANITVGTEGGTVTDGEGDTFNYSGAGSLYAVKNDIIRFNMTAAGDAIQMSTTNPVAVYYDGSAITIPDVVDADGVFAVSMGSDGNFFISDLGAGAKVDDRFTFENEGGTVEFEAEDGDIVGINGYTGDLTLYQLDTGLTINGDKLTYLFGEDTNFITATCDLVNGVASVSGLHSGDNITSTDEDTVFQFTTTGLTDVFTVNDNIYTVTNDNNGVIYITAGGVVTDLDEDATLTVDPAKAISANGVDYTADEVNGESVIGYQKKTGDTTSSYVTDAAHPLISSLNTQAELKNILGVAPDATYLESNDGSKDLSTVEGSAEYIFDTSGTNAVAFNKDAGKNLAIVDDTATGDKAITLGNFGDAVIMDGHDEYGSVNIIGGTGNDTIIVRGNVYDLETDAVYKGTTKTTIDLSQGGADKVITYAAANANIEINNYDEMLSPGAPGAGIVFHDPEIPYIKQDIVGAINDGLLVFEGNKVVAIDRDETTTGQDRKTQITVNNKNSAHQTMVRLFGYKDKSDTYSDDFGQLVGFTSELGGTLDASDITESVILIGNKDNNKAAGSYLKTGASNDTIFAGGMDTIDTGDGGDLIIMDDTADRKAATVIVGKEAGDVVQNLKSGFEGDIFDVTSYDGKLAYTFTDGLLAIVDESSKSSLGATTDETGQFIEQRFINGSDTLYAAIAQEGGTITVTDSDSTVPNYFLANDGAIDFTGFSGDVGLDVDGEDLDYPSAINGVSASIGSAVNSLIGGSGTTIFKGGKGNETLVAGTGESSLYGGGGQNVLIGDTSSVKTGSVEFFNIGIHNGAQNSIVGFEFIENGGSNQATFDNLNLGLADGNEVAGVEANSDGSVSLTIKGGESGAFEKATIADAAGKEMLIDRGTETETVAQIANSVVTVNNSYVDFYAATNDTSGATVQVGNIASTEIWLGGAPVDHDKKVADFNSSKFTVIDARNSSAEALMAGNELSNTIYGGLGTASMWGGEGNANDVMVGGSAHNEYYYEVGNGNDTILSARDGDVIHLGMSLDQVNFEGTEMGANGIVVRFHDGGAGSLYIDGGAEVSFSFDDGTNVKANRQTGQFE